MRTLKESILDDMEDVLKNSNKYLSAKIGKERRQLLKAKKDELLKTARVAKSMKVCEEQNGEYELYANALLAYTQNEVTSNATDRPKKLKLKPDMKLPDGSVNFIDTIAHKIHRDTSRRCEYDQKVGNSALEKAKNKVDNVKISVENAQQKATAAIDSNDFEQLYKAHAENYNKAQNVIKECGDLKDLTNASPFGELNQPKVSALQNEISKAEEGIAKSHVSVKAKMTDEKRREYEKDVERWAMADFIEAHETEFKEFLKEEFKKGSRITDSETQIKLFKIDLRARNSKNPIKQESIKVEIEGLKIKNNVEKCIQAEVICEQEQTEYEAWVNQHAGLDPEISKCIYYAERVNNDPSISGKFADEGSTLYKACQQKAEEMFNSENAQLSTSKEKQEKCDKLHKDIEEKCEKEVKKQDRNNLAKILLGRANGKQNNNTSRGGIILPR